MTKKRPSYGWDLDDVTRDRIDREKSRMEQCHWDFKASEAPERHRMRSWFCEDPKWQKTYGHCQKLRKSGCLVALVGEHGTGKTQIGVELIRKTIFEDNRRAKYTKLADFYLSLKQTFSDGVKLTEKQVIDRLAAVDLLVIDELSERRETDWEEACLRLLIDRRYDSKKDTVLIGNFLSREQCQKSLGDSITGRINECGGLFWCDWKSFR